MATPDKVEKDHEIPIDYEKEKNNKINAIKHKKDDNLKEMQECTFSPRV